MPPTKYFTCIAFFELAWEGSVTQLYLPSSLLKQQLCICSVDLVRKLGKLEELQQATFDLRPNSHTLEPSALSPQRKGHPSDVQH